MTQFSEEYNEKAGSGELCFSIHNAEQFSQQFQCILRYILLVHAMSNI